MVDTAASITLPEVLQGRYRLGPAIGHGSASTVYRGRDMLLSRDVAIKAFTARASDLDDLRAHESEARMLAGLNHPGLVTLLDAGLSLSDPAAPQMFLVMEYLPDADLRRRLLRGALSLLEVAYLAWDLLGGLDYVHQHGIIHRDLKPANVLLAEGGTRPARGKLADFGIAVLRGDAHEPGGEVVGTAAYLSPEQVEGLRLGPETDVYSLGLVLLEALTNRVAFPGGVTDSAYARLDRDPEIPADVPASFARLLRAMTNRDPAARPSAAEAQSDVRGLMVQEFGRSRPQTRDPEAERLAAVRDLNLLDTPPDATFDRITALAARIFDVPIAIISLVDENRVWLKSRHGVDRSELERSQGLGASGSLHDQTLVVEDLRTDPRTAGRSDVEASPIRFYAGVPLITAEGHNLGTLAVADTVPRRSSPAEVESLEDLAAMALHEMELRRAARRFALGTKAPAE